MDEFLTGLISIIPAPESMYAKSYFSCRNEETNEIDKWFEYEKVICLGLFNDTDLPDEPCKTVVPIVFRDWMLPVSTQGCLEYQIVLKNGDFYEELDHTAHEVGEEKVV